MILLRHILVVFLVATVAFVWSGRIEATNLVSPNGQFLVLGFEADEADESTENPDKSPKLKETSIIIISTQTGKKARALRVSIPAKLPERCRNAVTFHPKHAATLYFTKLDGVLYKTDLANNKEDNAAEAIYKTSGFIYDVIFSADGRLIAVVSYRPRQKRFLIDLLETEKMRLLKRFRVRGLDDMFPPKCAFDPTGSVFAYTDDESMYFYTIREGGSVWRIDAFLDKDGGPLTSIAFSPEGNTIASYDVDGEIRIWDLKTEKVIGRTQPSVTQGWRLEYRKIGETFVLLAENGYDYRAYDTKTWKLMWILTRYEKDPINLERNETDRTLYPIPESSTGLVVVRCNQCGKPLSLQRIDMATGKLQGPPVEIVLRD